jgi:Flp pilus assembly pilin Flp
MDMDPVTTTHSTAQAITEFGVLTILAAIAIVGAGISICALLRLTFSNYNELKAKVGKQEEEIKSLLNSHKDAVMKQLAMNTNVIREFCHAVKRCPGGKDLDPEEMMG